MKGWTRSDCKYLAAVSDLFINELHNVCRAQKALKPIIRYFLSLLLYFKYILRYSFEGLTLTIAIFFCFSLPAIWYRCYMMFVFQLGWGGCSKKWCQQCFGKKQKDKAANLCKRHRTPPEAPVRFELTTPGLLDQSLTPELWSLWALCAFFLCEHFI